MITIEVQIDEQTFERVQRLAMTQRRTLGSLITEIVQHLAATETESDPLLGLFCGRA